MQRRLFALSLVLLVALPLAAAEPKPRPTKSEALALLRAWLDAERAYEQIPAISAAVVHDQDVVWSGGSGYADLAAKRPASADTIYSICSISKLFTSVAAMQLRDQGKVSLDEPLSKYLPWFTMKTPAEGGPITLGAVLTHSAGLPRESDFPYWSGNFEFPTHEQVVERLKTQSALYPSDTWYQYSNLGLTLAGEVVSAAAGQPYADYVRQHIIQPLGLASTTPEVPAAERGKRLATGYSALQRDGTRSALPLFQARGIAPAAGYASTAEDLARFAAWQFRLLSKGGTEVLSARTLREMQRVHFINPEFSVYRGLGFSVVRRDDKTYVGHAGSCPGYETFLLMQNDEKIGVALLSNANGVRSLQFAGNIHDIVAPGLANDTDAPPAAALAPYVGSYSRFPWGGETIYFSWGGELAAIDAPNTTPVKDIERFRKTGQHTFRRIRKDGSLAEEIVFEMAPDGRARSVRVHSNSWPRKDIR